MAGEIASAAIGGGAGLISGMFTNHANKKRQKAAFKHDLQMTQLGFQFNADEAAKARQWQEHMYEKNLKHMEEYNSPINQMQRLREAGINPYSIAEGIANNGTINTDAPSGAQASGSPVSGSHYIPYENPTNLRDTMTAVQTLFNIKKSESERAGIDINNDITKHLGERFMLSQIFNNTGGMPQAASPEFFNWANQNGLDMAKNRMNNESIFGDLRNSNQQAQNSLLNLNVEHQRYINDHMDVNQRADYIMKMTQIFSNMNAGLLSYKQAVNEGAKYAGIIAESNHKKLKYNQAKELSEAFLQANKMSLAYDYIEKREKAGRLPLSLDMEEDERMAKIMGLDIDNFRSSIKKKKEERDERIESFNKMFGDPDNARTFEESKLKYMLAFTSFMGDIFRNINPFRPVFKLSGK